MKEKKEVTELRAALNPLLRRFKVAALFGFIASLLVLAPSGHMLEVYHRVVYSRNYMTLAMLTLAAVFALAIMEVLVWSESNMLYAAGRNFEAKLRDRVFRAMFRANLQGLPGGHPRTLQDLATLRKLFSLKVVTALVQTPATLVFLILIFLIHPLLAAVAMAFALGQVLVAWLNERATQPRLGNASRSAMQAQQYFDGTLRNVQVVEAMGMQRDVMSRWMKKQKDFLNEQADASDQAGGYQAVGRFLQNLIGPVMMGFGAWLVLEDLLQAAGLVIIGSILASRVLGPWTTIISNWRAMVNAREAWGRIGELLAAVPPPAETMALPPVTGALAVERVSATAPRSTAALLMNVGFALAPGETLAVIGPSASGKSTLAKVLVAAWPVAVGKVRLDGADVHGWNKEELGPQVGYLPQEVELFDGSIADNIARFGEADMAAVEAAGRAVGLHEHILALPEGYGTQVGRDGAMLSGGQRQRIGLARAIYGQPRFVVLDEPNSSLDEAGDQALLGVLKMLKAQGTTVIVMTHRTGILPAVDKLLVLRDGQAQAFGPRDEVLAALNKAAAGPQVQRARSPASLASPQTAGAVQAASTTTP